MLNNYAVVWGTAEIESKDGKNYKTLVFRVNGKFRFSVFLSKGLIQYYKELPQNPFKVPFALFGFLQENKGFLNFKVVHTKHIKYLL